MDTVTVAATGAAAAAGVAAGLAALGTSAAAVAGAGTVPSRPNAMTSSRRVRTASS